MSQFHRSPDQGWNQPSFVTAAQATQQQQSQEDNDPRRQFKFNNTSGLQQGPPQGQGQLQNPRNAGLYHGQTYPLPTNYAQQQQRQLQSQQPSQDVFQSSFVSGHVDPRLAGQGFISPQRSQSISSGVSDGRPIDPSFGATNMQPSSSFNYDPYSTNRNVGDFNFGGNQSVADSSEMNEDYYALSPESIQGYSSPTRPSGNVAFQFQGASQPSGSRSGPPGKRQRTEVETEGEVETGGEEAKGKQLPKPKACQRCKGLKVRCEPSRIPGTCKKCANGGHECLQPGETKRKRPPKREDLLKQIHDQTAQIQKLMGELEEANRIPREDRSTISDNSQSHLGVSANGKSSSQSALSPNSNDYFADARSNPEGTKPSKDVLDWIEKARQSLVAFGGYINIGGANTPRSFLAENDPEDPDTSDDPSEYYATPHETDEERIEIELQGPEGMKVGTGRELRGRLSDSSIGISSLSLSGKKADKSTNIPNESSPFGLMAEMARKKNRGRNSSNERSVASSDKEGEEEGTGIASANYFGTAPGSNPLEIKHGQMSMGQQPPLILTTNLISPQEAESLFAIFFDFMNLSVSLLDPVLYTAQKTCWRSPFLFTVICAISSRHYDKRPELHKQIMHHAQQAAGSELISGHKSVETVSAYILLALYPVPTQRWEDDRSWVYLGLAIRIATDLNLHHPNTAKAINEQHAREMLNRTRIWLNCFNLDRSMSSQYGKSPTIRNSDYVATNSEKWYNHSEFNLKNFDIHLVTYNNELRLVYDFVGKIYSNPNHPTGLNKEVDFEALATEADDALVALSKKWFEKIEKETDKSDPQNCFRTGLLKLAFSYARLISLSYGFQHSFGKNDVDENPFLLRCLRAATDVVNYVVDDIGRPSQRKYLRHGPEAQSVFVTFACAFLVKLLQPKFASYLSQEQRIEIRRQVQRVVDLLGSSEVAIDNQHGPKLYSRFLKGLLATPMAKIDLDGQPRKSRRPKSASPEEGRGAGEGQTTGASPASSSSLSPPPESTLAIPFDQFAPISGGIDPLLPYSEMSRAFTGAPLGDGMGELQLDGDSMLTNDFFRPPLPFDNEILQSMQMLSEPMWDVSLPGFSWMQSYQNPSGGENYLNEDGGNYDQYGGGYQQM